MIRNGLKKLREKKWYEKQDYSALKTFGSFDVSLLPAKYSIASEIMNQGSSNKCTAYAACAIQETQRGKKFDPDWFYHQEGVVAGEHSDYGYDLRTACKTGVVKGFRVLNEKDSELENKESSYFRIDNPFNQTDLIDDIRVAMFLAKDEKKCVITGIDWQSSWGSIIKTTGNEASGHAIKISGWDTIDGVVYLEVQNSYGTGFGKQGLNYISREVVNEMFKYGAFMWRKTATDDEIKTFSRMLSLLKSVLLVMAQILTLGHIWK